MTHKRAIIISAEFASFVGRGALDPAWLPPEPIVIGFGDMGEPAVSILASENIDDEAAGHILLFAISRPACLRMFGLLPSVKGSRSEEHTSELQSLMRISYAVFCLKNK